MKKILSILICLGSLFVSFSFAQKKISNKTKKAVSAKKRKSAPKTGKAFVCQLPASVTNIELNQTEITINCPSDDNSCINKKAIKITTIAVDYGEMKYVYSVSAGKILGEGANVEWDLKGVEPGTYTITAGISQYYPVWGWQVYGQTRTKAVKIK